MRAKPSNTELDKNVRVMTSAALAKKLNVSQATVSLALNDNPIVNSETRRRVKEAALHYNYSPNRIARAMRTGKTRTLGIIIPNVKISFFPDIVNMIETEAKQHGIQCLLCQSHSSFDVLETEIKTLIEQRVDGLILAPVNNFDETVLYQQLLKSGIPTVFCDYELRGTESSSAVNDNIEIGRLATQHLVELGHRQIAFFQGYHVSRMSQSRCQGYRETLEKAQIPYSEKLVLGFDEHGGAIDGASAITKLIDDKIPFTAIVAVSDTIAISAMKEALARGLRVPEDISIIGAANLEVSALVSPGLTTIDQHPEQIGKEAIRLLLEKIESPSVASKSVVVPSSLLLRQSTARIE
ncbi:MAG: LacI family DNA-binding transcriptional regulator [Chthoniobacteraceae bacterium]